nr:MAG TPA_asm: hypothetical protein [Bacteriophage sp.]
MTSECNLLKASYRRGDYCWCLCCWFSLERSGMGKAVGRT